MPQAVSYIDIGYDRFFKKQIAAPGSTQGDDASLANLYSQGGSTPDNSLLQQIPANNVVGGVMQSNGGNMSIDLNNGIFNYTDGVQTLLSIDPVNGLQINNNQGQSLVSTKA